MIACVSQTQVTNVGLKGKGIMEKDRTKRSASGLDGHPGHVEGQQCLWPLQGCLDCGQLGAGGRAAGSVRQCDSKLIDCNSYSDAGSENWLILRYRVIKT